MNQRFIRFCGTMLAICIGIITRANAVTCNLHPDNQVRKTGGTATSNMYYIPGCYSNKQHTFIIPYGSLPEHNACGGGGTGDASGSGSGSDSGNTTPDETGSTGDCDSGATWSQHCLGPITATGAYYCLDDGDWNDKEECGERGYITGITCKEQGILVASGMLDTYFSGYYIEGSTIADGYYALIGGNKKVYWWPTCYDPSLLGIDNVPYKMPDCAQFLYCLDDIYYSKLDGYGIITDYQDHVNACAPCPKNAATTNASVQNAHYSRGSGSVGITSCMVFFSGKDDTGTYQVEACHYTE